MAMSIPPEGVPYRGYERHDLPKASLTGVLKPLRKHMDDDEYDDDKCDDIFLRTMDGRSQQKT